MDRRDGAISPRTGYPKTQIVLYRFKNYLTIGYPLKFLHLSLSKL